MTASSARGEMRWRVTGSSCDNGPVTLIVQGVHGLQVESTSESLERTRSLLIPFGSRWDEERPHVFDLVLQAEEAVRGGPAGGRFNGHAQALVPFLAPHDLGAVGLNWTEEKKSLTDVPEVKPPGRPGEGEVDDGLGGELQHGALLGVGRERVGQLEVEAPAHELLAVDPQQVGGRQHLSSPPAAVFSQHGRVHLRRGQVRADLPDVLRRLAAKLPGDVSEGLLRAAGQCHRTRVVPLRHRVCTVCERDEMDRF
ncbi:hypothetical protein EYF80_049341 [Liparis tanakae]|uniref:Uncharacterized protein n=1 Tax=Liparis tanakae TaxID=230148 RepID=A0A4Z2FI86_9TELE|nr:hypothetical protein EYF80_049341 [Liparis tanakae]